MPKTDLEPLLKQLERQPAPPAGLRARTLERIGIKAPARPRVGAWTASLAASACALTLFTLIPLSAPRQDAAAPGASLSAPPQAKPTASSPRRAVAPAPQVETASLPPLAGEAPAQGDAPAPTAVAGEVAGHAAPKSAGPLARAENFPDLRIRRNVFRPAKGEALRVELALREHSQVKAWIIDATGRTVATIFDAPASGGLELRWDGRTDSGAELPSGAYQLLLKVGGQSRKFGVVLVR